MIATDPRLAQLYDIDNPDGPDHDFFRAYADERDARRIIDLGCGTGLLTVTLAGPERTVVGIDPDAGMLDAAINRPACADVTWLWGSSDRMQPGSADLVIMSGNVAMHIIRDEWASTLAAIADALVPGGRLVFETRNPAAEAWRGWDDPGSQRSTPFGELRESCLIDPPDADGVLVMHCRNEFLDGGDVIEVDQPLQYRDRERIERDLQDAGLLPVNVWSDWDRTPFTGIPDERLMIWDVER